MILAIVMVLVRATVVVTNLNKKKGCAFNEVNKVVFEVFGSFNHSHVNNIVNTVISNKINLNKKIKKL